MNTRMKYRIATIASGVLLTLLLVACQPGGLRVQSNQQPVQAAVVAARPQQDNPQLAQAVAAVANQQAVANASPKTAIQPDALVVPDEAIAIIAMTSGSSTRTHTVTRVYRQPNTTSLVVSFLMPDQPVRILGRNADGDYLAISPGEDGKQAIGWIASADLAYDLPSTHTRSVAKVYRQPEPSADAASILVPNQTVSLLGTNPGGTWSAVATGDYEQKLIGWVPTAELQLDVPTGEIISFTFAHLKADEDSSVYDVLTPTLKIALLGRSQDGAWIAVASLNGNTFRGWVRRSEVKITSGLQILPVLPNG